MCWIISFSYHSDSRALLGREDLIEPFSQDAKAFTESRLLQRQVQLVLDGISSGSGMSFLYGTLIHPNGIISVELAKNGLAQVFD